MKIFMKIILSHLQEVLVIKEYNEDFNLYHHHLINQETTTEILIFNLNLIATHQITKAQV
jgi:hypothetical protein